MEERHVCVIGLLGMESIMAFRELHLYKMDTALALNRDGHSGNVFSVYTVCV